MRIVLAKHRTQIPGHVRSTDNRLVDSTLLECTDTHFQRPQSGILLAGEGKARTANLELLGHPAGNDTAQRPHHPVRREGRPGRIAQFRHPGIQFSISQLSAKLFRPFFGVLLNTPAKAETGCIEIKAGSDEHPGKEQVLSTQPCVLQRLVSNFQHQQLTWKHLLDFFRRNPECSRGRRDLRYKETFEIILTEPFFLEPATFLCPPPALRVLWDAI